jgi:hypothetical protein
MGDMRGNVVGGDVVVRGDAISEEEGGDKFFVSSRESMSMMGMGTTVDATTIPFSCKSINLNQNVPSSNNNQQDI